MRNSLYALIVAALVSGIIPTGGRSLTPAAAGTGTQRTPISGAQGREAPITIEAMGAHATPLLRVRAIGGLCPEGPCQAQLVLFVDGRYRGAAHTGWIVAATLAEIRHQIAGTDFAALRRHPFRGTCPTAYDGQELLYTFYTRVGAQMLDSCATQIPATPLFLLVDRLLAAG